MELKVGEVYKRSEVQDFFGTQRYGQKKQLLKINILEGGTDKTAKSPLI